MSEVISDDRLAELIIWTTQKDETKLPPPETLMYLTQDIAAALIHYQELRRR